MFSAIYVELDPRLRGDDNEKEGMGMEKRGWQWKRGDGNYGVRMTMEVQE